MCVCVVTAVTALQEGALVSTYYASLRGLPQEPPEGDDGGHAGAVEEQEGGQTLQARCIFVVRQVVGGLALDVHEEASKKPGGTKHTRTREVV